MASNRLALWLRIQPKIGINGSSVSGFRSSWMIGAMKSLGLSAPFICLNMAWVAGNFGVCACFPTSGGYPVSFDLPGITRLSVWLLMVSYGGIDSGTKLNGAILGRLTDAVKFIFYNSFDSMCNKQTYNRLRLARIQ